ncbi:hypothetical protein WG909_14715 [Peptostreptococcaceae bacterium AGR-M142]
MKNEKRKKIFADEIVLEINGDLYLFRKFFWQGLHMGCEFKIKNKLESKENDGYFPGCIYSNNQFIIPDYIDSQFKENIEIKKNKIVDNYIAISKSIFENKFNNTKYSNHKDYNYLNIIYDIKFDKIYIFKTNYIKNINKLKNVLEKNNDKLLQYLSNHLKYIDTKFYLEHYSIGINKLEEIILKL